MMPVKKCLSLIEASCFMDMSTDTLEDVVMKNGLTISIIGRKKYYLVRELEELIESKIIIKKVK